MVDIETLGTRPGAMILSIGAVPFGADGIGSREFHHVVSRKSCRDAGFSSDLETVAWWYEKPEGERGILKEGVGVHAVPIGIVLCAFAQWLEIVRVNGPKVCVWGNGSDFDNALIQEAYRKVGMPVPWDFYNNRCYRTLKSLRPDIKIDRQHGAHHNALFDAKNQAEHAVKIINALGVWNDL